MSDETVGTQAPIPEEDKTSENDWDNLSKEETLQRLDELDQEALLDVAKQTAGQKMHWRDKARMAETRVADLEGKLQSVQPPEPKQPAKQKKSETNVAYEERLARVELRSVDRELTNEQMDEVMVYAKAKGVSPAEALQSSMIQSFITASRQQGDNVATTPSPSNRAGSGNPTFDEIDSLPEDQMRKRIRSMPKEEFAKYRDYRRQRGGDTSSTGLTFTKGLRIG